MPGIALGIKKSYLKEKNDFKKIDFFSLCYPLGNHELSKKFSQFGPTVWPSIDIIYIYIQKNNVQQETQCPAISNFNKQ